MRRLRVYDNSGDFFIEVPDEARVTFGYFNPAAGGDGPKNPGYGRDYGGPGAQTMKTTALRVYMKQKGEAEQQLACFLGVKGFRDEAIKMQRLVEKVIVEKRYSSDDETTEWSGKDVRELTVKAESDIPF